jgi:hypothetical protein
LICIQENTTGGTIHDRFSFLRGTAHSRGFLRPGTLASQ